AKFRLDKIYERTRRAENLRVQHRPARVFRESERNADRRFDQRLENLPALDDRKFGGVIAFRTLCGCQFRLLSPIPERRERTAAALEDLRRSDRQNARRSPWNAIRRTHVQTRRKRT